MLSVHHVRNHVLFLNKLPYFKNRRSSGTIELFHFEQYFHFYCTSFQVQCYHYIDFTPALATDHNDIFLFFNILVGGEHPFILQTPWGSIGYTVMSPTISWK